MKGDRVEIVIDAGGGSTKTYEVAATRAGRRVEVVNRRGVMEVNEVTRSGVVVRKPSAISIGVSWWSTPRPGVPNRRGSAPPGRTGQTNH